MVQGKESDYHVLEMLEVVYQKISLYLQIFTSILDGIDFWVHGRLTKTHKLSQKDDANLGANSNGG